MGQILVVEDDPAVQNALKRLFVAEGFEVETQSDTEGALDSFRAAVPSAVILDLDLNLPKISGKALCRQIKAEAPSVPIIVVSAASDISDKVLLLESGADDFVTKPFCPRELLARFHVALRHTNRFEPINPVRFDDVVVDFGKAEITREGTSITLTAGEFKTLQSLIENGDFVITRAELRKRVSRHQTKVDSRTIDNHVLKLRQKLEKMPSALSTFSPYTASDISSFAEVQAGLSSYK